MIKKLGAFIMIFSLCFGIALFGAKNAKAQSPLMDFGGFVYAIVPCTCSAGVWVMLINPNPDNAMWNGPYLWSLASPPMDDELSLAYPFPGMSLLGHYINDGQQCQIVIGTGCATLPTRGTFSTDTGKGIQPLGL